jgi:hypothetical protein
MDIPYMKKPSLSLVICFLLSGIPHSHPIWSPILLGFGGQRTLDEVIDRIESKRKGIVLKERADTGKVERATLICIKDEQVLEMWLNGKFVKRYSLTAFSGGIGPKKREGDGQIPEGVYGIEYLNPNSSYHLSLKVSYPNAWDRKWADEEGRKSLGGDIFIHGEDVSIGCIAIGNKNIEEVFWAVHQAKARNTSVIICPFDYRKLDRAYPKPTPKLEELSAMLKAELKKYPTPKR